MNNKPATEFGQDFSEQIQAVEHRLINEMSRVQAEILGAFRDWFESAEAQLSRLPAIEERLGLLEERISRIARGDLPPRPH